jgi:RNA polymerase sigma-70 factor (ECF subfamily)
MDDAAVIAESVRDPEVFAVVFDRHAPVIHRYLARRLGREAADDLVGDTFLAAFRRRNRYDTTHPNALPWLYGIATKLLAQHRREEARGYRLMARLAPDPHQHSHADRADAAADARSARAALLAALVRLNSRDRDVLLLFAWESLRYEEVAAALGIPVGTVRSRLARARRQVREALGNADPTATFDVFEESHHG